MGLLQATEVVKLVDRRGRAAGRPPAALRGARRDVHRAQGPPRPGVPDLLERPVGDHRRGDGRVPGLRGVLRRRRLGPRRLWPRSRSHRCCARPWAARRRSQAAGDDVGAVLRALAEQHPATQSQLFGADGSLNRYVNVYLNDEDVRVLDGLDTVGRRDGDTLVILPAMAGGCALAARRYRGRRGHDAGPAAARARRDPRRRLPSLRPPLAVAGARCAGGRRPAQPREHGPRARVRARAVRPRRDREPARRA